MPTHAIILFSIATGLLACAALAVAIWHTWHIELHRHAADKDRG